MSAIQRHLDLASTWRALEWCEAQLGTGMSAPQVARLAQKPPPEGLGMSRTAANRYVGTVLNQLQQNATVEPVESKRARMAEFWRGQIQRALGQKRAVVLSGVDVQMVDAPDLRAANQAGLALQMLEGLVEK